LIPAEATCRSTRPCFVAPAEHPAERSKRRLEQD